MRHRCLAHQNGDARFQFRRLDGNGKAPAEARFQSLLESVDFLRVPIAGQDHLLLTLEQRVEGVEEFFLRAVFSRKKLNIVDHETIQRSIGRFEIVDGVVLQRSHHVAHEALAVHVGQARLAVAFLEPVRHRVHQVRLAQTHAAINEQGVVRPARISRDLNRRGLGELVALALDEAVEGKFRIDAAAQHHRRKLARSR